MLRGGTAVSLQFLGGTEFVSSGGTDRAAQIGNGGYQEIKSGGSTSGATVSSGGTSLIHGSAFATNISSGGTQSIFSRGIASGGHVWGIEVISSGGKATGVEVNSGGTQIITSAGTAAQTTLSGFLNLLSDTASQFVGSKGVASGTFVSEFGIEIVGSGAPQSPLRSAFSVWNWSPLAEPRTARSSTVKVGFCYWEGPRPVG